MFRKVKIKSVVFALSLSAALPAASHLLTSYAHADDEKYEKRSDQASIMLRNILGIAPSQGNSDEQADVAMSAPATEGDSESELSQGASLVASKAKVVFNGLSAGVLSATQCIATIPGVKRLALTGIGGSYGAGLVSCRAGNSWSLPSYIQMSGVSYGTEIGADSTDLILVFLNHGAEKLFQKDSLQVGVDVGFSFGPIGRDGYAGSNLHAEDEVLSYSKSKGLYAGVSLKGAKLSVDKNANERIYGEMGKNKQTLLSTPISASTQVPAELKDYIKVLQIEAARVAGNNDAIDPSEKN